MASRMLTRASSRESPWETHPGTAGQITEYRPPPSGARITVSFIATLTIPHSPSGWTRATQPPKREENLAGVRGGWRRAPLGTHQRPHAGGKLRPDRRGARPSNAPALGQGHRAPARALRA